MIKSFSYKVFVCVFVCVCVCVCVFVCACSKPTTPKPYGYFRIALPALNYVNCHTQHVQFGVNAATKLVYTDTTNHFFFDIQYPSINSTIHCTYVPIHNNLPALLQDAQEMVYSHAVKASAIPEQEYTDTQNKVYGVFYELKGNTATPIQFFMTDSTHHFFRASVYINSIPNQDSLAPVIDYLLSDSRILMETLRWQ